MNWRSPRTLGVAAALLFVGSPLCLAADPSPVAYPVGAATFQANCAVCHGAKGAGQSSLAPPLTSYPVRYASIREGRRQLAMTVLYGMFGDVVVEQKHYDFKMSEFPQLDDDTLATVLNFVIFDLGHAGQDTQPLNATEIAAERSQPLDGTAVHTHRAAVLAALGL